MDRIRRLSAVPTERGYDLYVTTIEPIQAYGDKVAEFETGGSYSAIKITDLDLLIKALKEMEEEKRELQARRLAH